MILLGKIKVSLRGVVIGITVLLVMKGRGENRVSYSLPEEAFMTVNFSTGRRSRHKTPRNPLFTRNALTDAMG